MMKFSLFLSPLHTLRGWFHSIDIAVFQFSHQVSTSDWTCVAWWHWGSTTHLHWLQPLLLVPHYQHCRQPAWCLCWLYYCGQLGETGQTEHSLLLPDSFAGPDNTLGRASPLRTTCRAGTGPCLPPSSLAGRREDRGRVTTECSYCRRQVTAGGQLVMQPSCHLQLLPAAVELQSRRGKDSHCYSQSGYQEL